MGEYTSEIAVAFAKQTGTGTYNAGLDAITTTLLASDGLLLGDAESGIKGSGLSLTLGRSKRDKAFVAGSFTRSISDFLKAEVRTFTFAVPFCGNRANASGPPVDGDAIPLIGIDALLSGCGLVGTAWGSGVGHSYVYGSPDPISALVYYNGNRLELMDCRVANAIALNVGSVAILTGTIEVGSIKDHAAAALPSTLTYGEQQTVSAPVTEGIAHQWQDSRGYLDAVLSLIPEFEVIPDSNLTPPERRRQVGRETSLSGTLFADSAVDKKYEYDQMIETVQANLDQMSFLIGTVMSGTDPVDAWQMLMPDPELDESGPNSGGDLATNVIKVVARGTAGDDEIELIFQ